MRYPEHLTKEKAIKLHRQLWNYIADESERTGQMVSKSYAFYHFGWGYNVKALCWCCEYCNSICSNCPVDWDANSCTGTRSPYDRWHDMQELCLVYDGQNADLYKKYLKLYIKLAREIANLPEREDIK